MQLRRKTATGALRLALWLLAAALAAALMWRALWRVSELLLGGALIAFFALPLARRLDARLSRPLASLASLAVIALLLIGGLWLLLPGVLREIAALARTLPRSAAAFADWSRRTARWIQARAPGISLPAPDLTMLGDRLSGLAAGTIAVAGNIAEVAGRASLMVVLAYFMLCDRERVLLRLELLLPRRHRPMAVAMGSAVARELRLYLRGQLLVALTVGALAALGLAVVGVRSAAVLGALIGLFNMIPYFGPFIGGAPAVLIALGDGWRKAALTAAALAAVQQLDGSLIAPRILGDVTGLSPALVLVGIFAGASLAGVPGMLFALPVMVVIRTLYRVFVQRMENTCENI